MSHLYSAAITSITWADVERFCQQGTAENTYLDYKRDFPSDLAKTIAAMANTLGGIILIGVDEADPAGTPVLPLNGIDVQRGLEERVLSTILDTMSPPVIPQIVTCLSSAGDRAIVVIRVPQSENAPHALRGHYVGLWKIAGDYYDLAKLLPHGVAPETGYVSDWSSTAVLPRKIRMVAGTRSRRLLLLIERRIPRIAA